MKLFTVDEIPIAGKMEKALRRANRWPFKKKLAYFDLTQAEYTQLKQEMYWPGETEILHFWQVEIRVDGVPTWHIQKQKGTPSAGGVTSIFSGGDKPTTH